MLHFIGLCEIEGINGNFLVIALSHFKIFFSLGDLHLYNFNDVCELIFFSLNLKQV